ncbi:hypothetical protein ACFVTZ_03755 [Cellulosimicrobium cellulans]|uniref:hypothetical protein n=1 Tax=Cellulosimicrobium cellulans TaxID=1710 RepID=UPI0036E9EACE
MSLLLGGLSACTGGEAPQAAAPTTGDSGKKTYATQEEYQLAFFDCLRGSGLEVADPSSGSAGLDMSQDGFAEAVETCAAELGTPPAAEGADFSDEATLREYVRIAQCLREAGYTIADPKLGEELDVPAEVTPEAFDACIGDAPGAPTS